MSVRKILSGLLAALLLAAISACSGDEEVPELLEPAEIVYDTAVVTRGDLSRAEYYDAYVVAEVDELSFDIAGTVASLHVQLGDAVKAGDLLAELDTTAVDRAVEDVQKALNDYYGSYAYRSRQYEYTKTEQELRLREATGGRTLEAMDADIAARSAAITAMESEVASLEESIAARNARIAALEEEIASRTDEGTDADGTEDSGTDPAPASTENTAAKALEDERALLAAEESRLEACRAELEKAKEELEKLKADRLTAEELGLALEQTNTAIEYLDANYGLQQSYYATSLEELAEQREACFLYAPRDGVVTGITLPSVGSGVGLGTIVLRIAANDTAYLRYLEGGQNLSRRTARAEANLNGRICALELIPYSDAELRAYAASNVVPPARFRFTDPGVQASPGQFAQLILYAQERTNVLYVPRGALYQSGGGSNGYVYRVVDGEKVYTSVTYGIMTDAWAEICSGLEEGDVVYVG